MIFLPDNLRYLRARHCHTQQDVADFIFMTRGSVASYERGVEPPLAVLQRIGKLYGVSIELLVWADLSHIDQSQLEKVNTALSAAFRK